MDSIMLDPQIRHRLSKIVGFTVFYLAMMALVVTVIASIKLLV